MSKITLEKSESVTLKRPKHEEEIGSKNMMPMCKSQKKTEVDNKKLGYEALTYAFQVGKSYINSRVPMSLFTIHPNLKVKQGSMY